MNRCGRGRSWSRRTKLRVYNAIVVPTMMYESETWVLNKQQESAVQATEMYVLRRIVEGLTG